ncbi:MAG: hypothetical protein SGJ27_09230 [Candidatus Melainabacteria bacterium]|nr:hypothetical protein [Candidatus Melainabacteria bacterium]
MTEAPIGKPTRAAHLRVIVNEDFVDKVEETAKLFADRLEADYASMVVARDELRNSGIPQAGQQSGLNFASAIDVDNYPEDEVVERVVKILGERGWSVDPTEHACAGGRAGTFWMTPLNVHRKF